MTVYGIMSTPLRQPVLTICLLILVLQLYFVVNSFRHERSAGVKCLYTLYFLTGFALFYLMMLDVAWEINDPGGSRPLLRILGAFLGLPLAAVFLMEGISAVLLAFALTDLIRFRNGHLTADCIKETMDLLPAGIAFGKEDGTVVFSNLVMNDVARNLTGRELTDLDTFRNDVTGNKKSTAGNRDPVQVDLPGGAGVWLLSEGRTKTDGGTFVQLTATDITEQAAFARELEEKNKKLRDIRMRLDIYNRQAERTIISQELLAARMAVHNEVGSILLESRHYLNDPSSIDEEVLLQALKDANTYLLREYEEDDTAGDSLADALEMAEAIGVQVKITGPVPEKGTVREILAAAVSECATNTVKHADGDQLSVVIRMEDRDVTFILRSSGTAPEGEIRESGGLLSLRTLVEREGGAMKIESVPEFCLTILLN